VPALRRHVEGRRFILILYHTQRIIIRHQSSARNVLGLRVLGFDMTQLVKGAPPLILQ
jgi:hypothetical protein